MVVNVRKHKTRTKSEYPQTEVELTPDILELLSGFSLEEIETGVVSNGHPPVSGSHTFQDLKDAYSSVLIEHTIGDMLRAAREQQDHSLKDTADALGVSRSRAHQLEQPEVNLRIDTLQRFAGAYGYIVQVALIPKDPNRQRIVALLPDNQGNEPATPH